MYTISEAADRAGVTSELLRAWERRYAVVTPRRTPAGYRLYDEAAIARVRAMRSLVDDGWTPSAAAEHLRDLSDDDLPTARVPQLTETPDAVADDLTARFVDAAARMDRAAVQAFLDDVSARGSFETVAERYVFPALRALGDAWSRGIVSVAAEHAASAAVSRWLGIAYQAAAGSAEGRPVLIGLPPGARHELGALAFATAARRRGLNIHYVGADLPAADWLHAARSTGAVAVVIAVPTAEDVGAARRVATALRRAKPTPLVLFGGPASDAMPRGTILSDGPAGAALELQSRLAAGQT
ncbi:MAG TPA: MerR family transcriptional regulator [Candidatus Limnocylindria bacterium]|nr:MerR family transcriptional regulator [Candidatus Limnocylindria bacterium]